MSIYIEENCIFEHEGRQFESGGAILTPDYIIAYLSENNILTDWHGKKLGTYKITATWKTPYSFLSPTMNQVEATVNDIIYTGRSGGIGTIYQGKRKKKSTSLIIFLFFANYVIISKDRERALAARKFNN